MADRRDADVTALLQQWQNGDSLAMERLLPLVYDELRRVARARLRGERQGHTLQATALVHEAYLRLIGSRRPTPKNRAHFFAMAARVMRQILVDHARRKQARKRGSGDTAITLDESSPADAGIGVIDLLALDEALTAMIAIEPRMCHVVELKFFAGLNTIETAEALNVSTATVERDWTLAKAWLVRQLSSPDKH